MKAHCLPFEQIPDSTRLFTDFLQYSPNVQPFYPHSANFNEWVREQASALQYDTPRREQVSEILKRQNTSWNASPQTLANIERLRKGAAAAVTGQQVGLFGGPMFAFYKALTAVKLAEEATAAGVDTVPVFWLATYDHDLAEVNHVSFLGAEGMLRTLSVSSHSVDGAPVSEVRLGDEILPVVEEAASLLGESEVMQFLRESYRPGESMGTAFARLFARLFASWGVILLDAADAELHRVAAPVYRAAIERAGEFIIGGDAAPEKISEAELLERISSRAETFSPNVLLRPVVQDYLLPTIAYAGGPAEIAYFAQVGAVYETLGDRVTPVVPRFSATLVEAKTQRWMQHYGVSLAEVFQGVENLRRKLAASTLPEGLQSAFDKAQRAVEDSLAGLRKALEDLDPTLLGASQTAASKMNYQLDRLRQAATAAELRKSEVVGRHAEALTNKLYPEGELQERGIAGVYFVARHGLELLRGIYDAILPDCHDHQILEL